MAGSLAILKFFFLSFVAVSGTQGVKIQFFHDAHEIWQVNSTTKCANFPEEKITEIHSITTDTCFIAYEHLNCKSTWSAKFVPEETHLPSFYLLGGLNKIKSVQTCSVEEGGNQLNVDITSFFEDVGTVPDVLESYKNVCSCISIPEYVQNMPQWSIDNHQNFMFAYFEPNCSESQDWYFQGIPAGQTFYTRHMHVPFHFETEPKAIYKSFGPDLSSTYFQTSCMSTLNVDKDVNNCGLNSFSSCFVTLFILLCIQMLAHNPFSLLNNV